MKKTNARFAGKALKPRKNPADMRTWELLEARIAPAVFIVDYTGGGNNPFADSTDSATHGGSGTMADPFHMASLRGATIAANAIPGSTILLIAGTYTLSIPGDANDRNWTGSQAQAFNPNIGDLDIYAAGTTIDGAGPGLTTIQSTTGADRIITVNPNATPGAAYTFTLSDVTMKGGRDTSNNHGGGAIFLGAKDNISNITNCVFVDNKVTAIASLGGGAIQNTGGNLTVTNCVFGGTGPNDPNTSTTSGGAIGYDSSDFVNAGGSGTLTVINSTFINNVANSSAAGGGAIQVSNSNLSSANAIITGCTFIGNQAPNQSGGAIVVESGTLTVTTSSFVNNSAKNAGGAIYGSGVGSQIHFNRFVNNTTTLATGKTLNAQTATMNATDNWWGRNSGPTASEISANVTATTWLQLRHVSALTNILEGTGSTGLTADILGRANSGGTLAPTAAANLLGLPAFPSPAATIFSNPAVGTITGASTQFVNGIATATFNAAATTGAGGADATADSQTVRANITVSEISVTKVDSVLTDVDGDTLADPGDTLRYTLVITNPSQQTATSVGFTDTPGANTSLVVGSVTTTNGTITSGNTAGNTSVGLSIATIAPGATVTITFDALVSPATIVRSVSNQGSATRSVFTILTDDPAVAGTANPTATTIDMPDVKVELLGGTSFAEDGAGTLVYTFTREGPLTPGRTINFSVGGLASLIGDFTLAGSGLTYTAGAATGTLAFAAGSATATITLSATDDNVVENNETVILTVTPEGGSALGYDVGTPSVATGTINNDDTATLTLTGGITQNEGNSGTVSYVFTATLDNPVQGGFSVLYTTNNGTATAGSDYTDNDGSLSFTGNANEQKTITVLVHGDNTVELDETFTVALGALSGSSAVQLAAITPSGSPQTATIANDDTATVSIAGNVSQAENLTPQVFTVTLSNPVDTAVTVLFNTSNGTASAGSDYTAITNQLVTFAPNTTTAQTVNVIIANENVVEANEVFNVAISALNASGRNVSLGTSAGTGTIVNDDSATVTLTGGGSADEGNAGTTARVFTATLSNPVQGGFSIAYSTNNGSATTANNDYQDNDGTLVFTGTANEQKTITVNVVGDTDFEADETFTVTLGAISGAPDGVTTAGSPQTATITNDDAMPIVTIAANKRSATFFDVDGDLVTVAITLGTLEESNFVVVNNQFAMLDLTAPGDAESFAGSKVTITARRQPAGGDGLVNLGFLNAAGIDLGKVTVNGDLGRIIVGDANAATPALGAGLSVYSMGRYGTTTQPSLAAPDLESVIFGGVTTFKVRGDVLGASLTVVGGTAADAGRLIVGGSVEDSAIRFDGAVGTVAVTGSVISTNLFAAEGIGTIVAGTTPGTYKLTGGVSVKGSVIDSAIQTNGVLSSLKVSDSVVDTLVTVRGNLAPASTLEAQAVGILSIGGTVDHAAFLVGYDGTGAAVNADVQVGKLNVGVDWIAASLAIGVDAGADGMFATADDTLIPGGSAGIVSRLGSGLVKGQFVAPVDVAASFGVVAEEIAKFRTGNAPFVLVSGVNGLDAAPVQHIVSAASGSPNIVPTISADGRIATFLDIDGDLVTVKTSVGTWTAANFEIVSMTGSVAGGGQLSLIDLLGAPGFAGATVSVTAKPGPLGGNGLVNVGYVDAAGVDLKALTVKGDLGRLDAGDANAATIAVTTLSAQSMGLFDLATQPSVAVPTLESSIIGGVKSLKIAGDLFGIHLAVDGVVETMSLGGSMIGSVVEVNGGMASLKIRGDIDTSAVQVAGSLGAIANGTKPGTFKYTGGVSVGGEVFGSLLAVEGDLSRLVVSGSVISSVVTVLGDAVGTTDVLAAQTLGLASIKGRVEETVILVGYNAQGAPVNGDVQAGKVSVGVDWIASSMAIGTIAGPDGNFGTADDALIAGATASPIVARIASVVVKGHSSGAGLLPGVQFGIAAEQIGAFKTGNAVLPLTAGTDVFQISALGDVTVREV